MIDIRTIDCEGLPCPSGRPLHTRYLSLAALCGRPGSKDIRYIFGAAGWHAILGRGNVIPLGRTVGGTAARRQPLGRAGERSQSPSVVGITGGGRAENKLSAMTLRYSRDGPRSAPGAVVVSRFPIRTRVMAGSECADSFAERTHAASWALSAGSGGVNGVNQHCAVERATFARRLLCLSSFGARLSPSSVVLRTTLCERTRTLQSLVIL